MSTRKLQSLDASSSASSASQQVSPEQAAAPSSAASSAALPPSAAPSCVGAETPSEASISPAFGVFGVGARLASATASSNDEIRLDFVGSGGMVSGPLAVVRVPIGERQQGMASQGSVRDVFVDIAQRDWADEPGVVWHMRRRVEELCAARRRPLDCPDADETEWMIAHGETFPLGVLMTSTCGVVMTGGDRGVVWLDRLTPSGLIDSPLGIVTRVDTAIPRLFLDMNARKWAGEAPVAWHLTRSAIDRFWSAHVEPARIGGPNNATEAEVTVAAEPIESLLDDRCSIDDVGAEYRRWHGDGPYPTSAAHPIDPANVEAP